MTGLQHHQGWWERMQVSASKLLWNKREVDGYRLPWIPLSSHKSLQRMDISFTHISRGGVAY